MQRWLHQPSAPQIPPAHLSRSDPGDCRAARTTGLFALAQYRAQFACLPNLTYLTACHLLMLIPIFHTIEVSFSKCQAWSILVTNALHPILGSESRSVIIFNNAATSVRHLQKQRNSLMCTCI